MKSKTSRGLPARTVVMGIVLSALVPFVLAWYFAQHPEWVQKTSNYGKLVVPVRALTREILVSELYSDHGGEEEIKGRWILLEVSRESCRKECQDALYKTHQGWLMLNKEMQRVRRVLLVEDPEVSREPALIQDETLIRAHLGSDLARILDEVTQGASPEGAVFLVDPQMNLALWYPMGFDPYQLVKDLKHLLRASQIG